MKRITDEELQKQEGKTYGLWLVIEFARRRGGKIYFLCECQCPLRTRKEVQEYDMKVGKSTCCGCDQGTRSESIDRHGMSDHPLYKIHDDIERRCRDQNDTGYHNYGARGIYVVDEWKGIAGRLKFIEWALANGWEKGLETDRIDNEGPYSPGNCRFVTHKENDRNMRKNRKWEYQGKMMTCLEMIETSGSDLKQSTLWGRLDKGMDPELALSLPKMRNRTVGTGKFEYQGQIYTARELVEHLKLDMPPSVLSERILRFKFTVEEAISKPYVKKVRSIR